MSRSIWIVEDNRILREALSDLVSSQPDMDCPLAMDSCEELFAALDGSDAPDIALIDIGLPGRSGIEGVARLASESPTTKSIILSVHADDDKVFQAIQAGARGYLLKPSSPEEILAALRDVDAGVAPINAHIASRILDLFARLAPPRPPAEGYNLTPREREILQLIVDGRTSAQIGESLGISVHTVNNHTRNIYEKLHVHSRASAVAKAMREDLL